MSALKGNEYYKIRTTNGRNRKYSPSSLKKKANEYFQWAIDNPLLESKVVTGTNTEEVDGKMITRSHAVIQVPKMRPFTLQGFCNYASISNDTFKNYEKIEIKEDFDEKKIKEAKDFLAVTKAIRGIIENQQFEGAASGFLNHNIIARRLGLIDKQQLSGDPERPLMGGKVTMVIKERKLDA